jgi:hypothetical protein
MPPKTFIPRHDDGSSRSSGDPIRSYLHNFALEKKSRLPVTTSPYVDVNDESDDDLHRYRSEKEQEEQPQVPQRPPITALIQALDSFADKPLAKLGPRTRENTEAFKREMSDIRNLVRCPMPNCGGGATTETVLIDHWRKKHPEVLQYDRWLKNNVQSPFLHFSKQLEYAEEDFHTMESQIQRRKPLLEALQNRKIKIQDKYGVSETIYRYGSSSPEAELAREKSADELAPILRRIAELEGEIATYKIRLGQVERQYYFADRKLADMQKDKDIAPLLKPIELQGGKQTWLFTEERKSLASIVDAIQTGIRHEQAQWVSPRPSKGTLIPQRSPREEREHVRHLQSYVREYDE